jgi:hypothetical protein
MCDRFNPGVKSGPGHSDSSSPANRLAALSLINDSYKYLMDLTTNGIVVTDAIKFVQTNKEKLVSDKKEDKESDYDEDRQEEEEIDQSSTVNQVF